MKSTVFSLSLSLGRRVSAREGFWREWNLGRCREGMDLVRKGVLEMSLAEAALRFEKL